MKILFIHQNFPGQFKFLAPALVQQGHTVLAMTMQKVQSTDWQGVKLVPYSASRGTTPNVHPWVSDFETKTIRGEACFKAALALKQGGFTPDVIIAHHGWGESLFLKEVWPQARLGIYCEFYYNLEGSDVGFDPEHSAVSDDDACRLRMRNANNILHFDIADAGLSPTQWQKATFPQSFRDKISVVHEGIDTDTLRPNDQVMLKIGDKVELRKGDPVITFVNRNLEPYRGYHVFMRALPGVLKAHPTARVLMIGGDEVSYGAAPPDGRSWKDIYLDEVRPQLAPSEISRIHFLGKLPYEQFVSVMQASMVHVYLTYPFVLSWSLLEAMSIGCSIIASDTAPVREVIEDGRNGVLVDFFRTEALAQETLALLGDPTRREALATQARASAIASYDLRRICMPEALEWSLNF